MAHMAEIDTARTPGLTTADARARLARTGDIVLVAYIS